MVIVGLQPAENVDPPEPSAFEVVATRVHLRLHHDGYANLRGVRRIGAIEARLADADHCHRIPVDGELSADDAGIRGEIA